MSHTSDAKREEKKQKQSEKGEEKKRFSIFIFFRFSTHSHALPSSAVSLLCKWLEDVFCAVSCKNAAGCFGFEVWAVVNLWYLQCFLSSSFCRLHYTEILKWALRDQGRLPPYVRLLYYSVHCDFCNPPAWSLIFFFPCKLICRHNLFVGFYIFALESWILYLFMSYI